MTTAKNNKYNQDDEVLARLYKEGAKEEPPTKLNNEIINYAATANKPEAKNSKVSSHFGGGWKVPLSMAASLVVVFALLIQLEQSPQQLEIPPIPEASRSTESKDELFKSKTSSADISTEETMADDTSSMEQEVGTLGATKNDTIQLKEKKSTTTTSKAEEAPEAISTIEHDRSLERLIPQDRLGNSYRADKNSTDANNNDASKNGTSKNDTSKNSTPILSNPAATESNLIKSPITKASKPHAAKKQIQISNDDALSSHSETFSSEAIQHKGSATDSTAQKADTIVTESDRHADIALESEQEFAPIPVEDWLLMIEQLVARKDYAEAARQLEKFKYAHPKVNVEDLDAKIP
jgi:hypothetical protein